MRRVTKFGGRYYLRLRTFGEGRHRRRTLQKTAMGRLRLYRIDSTHKAADHRPPANGCGQHFDLDQTCATRRTNSLHLEGSTRSGCLSDGPAALLTHRFIAHRCSAYRAPSHRSCRRLHVRVQAKQIARIVLVLDSYQPRVVLAVIRVDFRVRDVASYFVRIEPLRQGLDSRPVPPQP